MAKRDPMGTTISVDISQLKTAIDEANALIKENESQWRVNASAMEDWTKEERGLTGRLKVWTAHGSFLLRIVWMRDAAMP